MKIILFVGALLGLGCSYCTKAQTVAAVNTGVQVGVDICTEAPQLIPPGTPAGSIVALLCPAVVGAAPTVEVFIDTLIWDALKKEYAAKHAKVDKVHPDGF